MEAFSEKELLAIALTLKDIRFPDQRLFSLEVKYGIAFNEKEYEKYEVDDAELEQKISRLRESEPAEFEKLYLAMEKFWEGEVISPEERLRELKLVPA